VLFAAFLVVAVAALAVEPWRDGPTARSVLVGAALAAEAA
jgi:hypothetical protein